MEYFKQLIRFTEKKRKKKEKKKEKSTTGFISRRDKEKEACGKGTWR